MYIINLLGSASPSCVFNLSCSGTCPAVTFEVQRMYDQHFIEVAECISIFNFSAVNVFHVSMLCTCNCLLLKFSETETEVIVILPSFLLKSLQFIFLLCQGGLQVQVTSIMGQLKGTVIRLDGKKTQSNTDFASIL